MSVAHVYHVYVNGNWIDPVREHVLAMARSDLWLHSHMYIGFVGNMPERRRAADYIHKFMPFETITEADGGWEQETMRHIPIIAKQHSQLFYAHTKGAVMSGENQHSWRQTMTYFNVMRWRQMLAGLQDNDLAGIWWIPGHVHPAPHFQGNFWWANTDYLLRLPEIETGNRWQAELWVGQREPRIYETYQGSAGGAAHVTDWLTFDLAQEHLSEPDH